MPWQFVPDGRYRRTRRRRNTNGGDYDNGRYNSPYDTNPYDNEYDDFIGYPQDYDDAPPRRGRRRDNGDDFDGFYDAAGNRINLVIQSPRDMLPPQLPREEDMPWATPVRRRARF